MATISTPKFAAIFALALAVALAAAAAAAARLSIPLAPRAWSSAVAAWLRPPYLYAVINAIIISIAASSRFHGSGDSDPTDGERLSSPPTSTVVAAEDLGYRAASTYRRRDGGREVIPVPEVIKSIIVEPDGQDIDNDKDDHDHDEIMMIRTTPKRTDSLEETVLTLTAEKPLVSASFSGYRNPVKPGPDQGGLTALKVTKPKQNDSLENTWKAITEGRSTPFMKKCDTWQNHGRQIARVDFDDRLNPLTAKRSETFKDRTNQKPPGVAPAVVLRKEPPLSQDELNRRVEAFIKKFNDDMKLQRQESLNQYLEMINRGTH